MSLPDPRERRTVTVLFSDLSGFTRLAGGLDPEEVGDLIDALFRRLRAVVERHGGTVDKFIGDAVMAVFGAPSAHADDAARAVRAGLAMQREMAAFNAERRTSLSMRIGINTGEVLWGSVGGDRPTAIGDAVNLAQRLEAAAAPGAVLAAASTARAASAAARWGPPAAVAVRGRDEPLDAREALGEPDGRGDLTAITLRAGPLVGREPELARLTALLDAPGPSFICLRGDAGVGKSRLLAEFRALAAARGRRISTGRALEAARLWCGPFAEIIRSDAGAPALDEEGEARIVAALQESLAAVEPDAVTRENTAHLIALAIGCAVKSARVRQIDPSRIPSETRHAWLRWLESRARTRPTLLCVEDFHWADSGTRAVLEAATSLPPGLPLLVVATARPGAEPPAGFSLLDLREFSPAATAACAAALLGAPPDPALARWLADKSGGNPFFVEALARHLADEGLVEGNPCRLSGPIDRVPDGLAGLLTARLDALPTGVKNTIKAASVLGRAFWKGLLGEITGGDPGAALEEARLRELVFPQDDSLFPGEAQYVFKHALLRDAAYSLLPRRERGRLHAAAADRLEARCKAGSWRLRALAARHRADAGQPAEAAALWAAAAHGALADFAHDQAAAYAADSLALVRSPEALLAAGSAANGLGRHDEALRFLAEAEACPETASRARVVLQLAFATLGRMDEAIAVNDRVIAAETGAAERAVAFVRRAWLLDRGSREDQVPPALAKAREEIGAAGGIDRVDAGSVVDLEFLVAHRATRFGLFEDSLRSADLALAIARRSSDARRIALAHNNRGIALQGLKRRAEALEAYAEGEKILRSLGDRRDLAVCLNNSGRALEAADRLEEAEREYAESVALKRAIGLRVSLPVTLVNLGSARIGLGRTAEGVADLEEALALARANADPRNTSFALLVLGHWSLSCEDLDNASSRYEESAATAGRFFEPRVRLNALVHQSVILNASGRFPEGLALLRDADRQADETGDSVLRGECRSVLASALFAAGEWDHAVPVLRESIAAAAGHRDAAPLLGELGAILSRTGDHAGAREALDRAVERARASHRPALESAALAERAQAAARAGDVGHAESDAAAAVEAARRSGIPARLANTQAVQARVLRDPVEAVKAARKAVASAETPAPRARALSVLARRLAQGGGAVEEAEAALRQARELWPMERWNRSDRMDQQQDGEEVRAASGGAR